MADRQQRSVGTPRLTLIAALARSGVIGQANALPWHLPADLKHFRQLTLGKPVMMGRKTFLSIGRPLPKRTNIIVTRNPDFKTPGCLIAHSLEEAILLAGKVPEIMIIGGAELFRQALPLADRLELTHIDAMISGDVFFPTIVQADWEIISEEAHKPDSENPYPYRFVRYQRTQAKLKKLEAA